MVSSGPASRDEVGMLTPKARKVAHLGYLANTTQIINTNTNNAYVWQRRGNTLYAWLTGIGIEAGASIHPLERGV